MFSNILSVSYPECSGPLGMEGGIISNQQITASSTHRALFGLQKWYPYFARLNKKGLVNAWTAAENDRWPWIQVTDAQNDTWSWANLSSLNENEWLGCAFIKRFELRVRVKRRLIVNSKRHIVAYLQKMPLKC